MRKIIAIVLMLLVLCSCAPQTTGEDFWANAEYSNKEVQSGAPIDVVPATEEEIQREKDFINMLCGENWNSENYNKTEIEIPEVLPEATVEGELWFPPINNTAPIDEIAPTISYQLMLDGLLVNTYYPDNPDDYTAQALNENAFPIAFFRKLNDLYYYTVCKVEGGGYMYYFFMANSDVTVEEALAVYDDMIHENEDGTKSVDKYYYLFNSELADLSHKDLTKEVIWRASAYSYKELGELGELYRLVNDVVEKEGREASYYVDIAPQFKVVTELMPRIFERIGAYSYDKTYDDFYDVKSGLEHWNYRNLLAKAIFLYEDNLTEYTVQFNNFSTADYSIKADEATPEDYQNTVIITGGGTSSPDNYNRHFFSLKGYDDFQYDTTEENTVMIKILPKDYMW